MDRRQIYAVFDRILTLLANLIAVGTFAAGIFIARVEVPSRVEIPIIIFILSALAIIYGNFSISFALASRRMRRMYVVKYSSVQQFAKNAATSVGMLSFPLTGLWMCAFVFSYSSYPTESIIIMIIFSLLIAQSAIIAAVSTAVTNLLPVIYNEAEVAWRD